MPLEPGKSKEAFSHNVATEMEAGKPQEQALAIAYKTRGEDASTFTPHERMPLIVVDCTRAQGGR